MNLATLSKFSIGPSWSDWNLKFILPIEEEYNYIQDQMTGLYKPFFKSDEGIFCFETDDCFIVSFKTEKEVLDFLNYARLKFL